MKERLKYLDKKMSRYKFKKFTKSERSSFKYWYNHWKAFNLTAWYLGVWKPKYIFHDIEKPWLKLFLDYTEVQKFHRKHNRHHSEYKGGLDKVDWEGLIIDNECSHYTKEAASLRAREYIDFKVNNDTTPYEIKEAYKQNCYPILDKWKI